MILRQALAQTRQRSEYAANLALSEAPALPSWMRPAPTRQVKRASLLRRLLGA